MVKLTMALLLALGIVAAAASGGGSGHADMATLPAVIPAAAGTLPAHVHSAGPTAEMAYQAAIDHPEIVGSVPCLCGCIEALGHESNLDCYIEAAGTGVTLYSSHGLYCGVCQLITRDALDGAARGMSADALRAMIVERYGS